MPIELAKTYAPKDVEPQVLAQWNDSSAFHATPVDRSTNGKPYCIVIPPPNVTAALHMGHALNNTIQDILIRWRRMMGDNAVWIPGTDHAGIATQTVVEKRVLREEGKKRTDFARDEFVAKIQKWKDEYEQTILGQLKAMGCSCDWDRTRFTMDEVCAAAVREAFFKLFADGLIYRGKRLVNWDPVTQTALADDEVEMEEVDGQFYYLRYPLSDGSGFVTVATTRPETMLGDTAVAINPKDPRAAALRGKSVRLPIVNRVIPIVEDDYVVLPTEHGGDPADSKATFATGFLKVTPAHDENDWQIGLRHKLPVINVFSPTASISVTHGWPEDDAARADAFLRDALVGKDRVEARKAIVRWFKEHELFESQKPYKHSVGHSYRSHVPIEPYLSDQWYVKVTDERLAGAALRAMATDQIASTGATTTASERAATVRERSALASNFQQTYFITFSCYGTWLHGDARGSVDRTHNEVGTEHVPENAQREKEEFVRLKHEPVVLDTARRVGVANAIHSVCAHRGWSIVAGQVRSNHVHVVVSADVTPERVLNDFKAYSTRRLVESGLIEQGAKVWTRHGSTRYLNDDASVEAARSYVLEDQGDPLEGAMIQPLPHGRGSSDASVALNEPRVSASGPNEPRVSASGMNEPRVSASGPNEPRVSASGHAADRSLTVAARSDQWQGKLRFHPPRYAKTFQNWHENIRDWCISRQLWWGHRIPVWSKRCSLTGGDWFLGDFNLALSPKSEDEALRILSERPIDIFHFPRTGGSVAVARRRDGNEVTIYVCPSNEFSESKWGKGELSELEMVGFTQDPDVLDTWFSSALWPFSTLGWPDPSKFPAAFPDGDALAAWNPGNVLCTAREIITLWVSRMVMTNLYLRDCLPFTDVFIHAMIQDGEGQKMSKSLGNGVDPLDIIHSHGSDAMRFTLAAMTTQTQDVRMPVSPVCPKCSKPFTPAMVTVSGGYKVMAPTAACTHCGQKMVTSYGLSQGEAVTTEIPGARNTSEKFDYGRNFTNKLWNAVRFALANIEQANSATAPGSPGSSAESTPEKSVKWELSLPDKWILSRLASVTAQVNTSLPQYEFSNYAQVLYDFVWRDLCDWYIEAVKPVVGTPAGHVQRRVLEVCIDASLRMLHPAMPFVTEKLWEPLNDVAPVREISGVMLVPSGLLIHAKWPVIPMQLHDDEAEREFELVRKQVSAIREVRTTYKVPPRQRVLCTAKAPGPLAQKMLEHRVLVETLANMEAGEIGPGVEKPAHAAGTVVGDVEIYIHNLVEATSERDRLTKRLEEVRKSAATLEGRLSNKSYIDRAPANLVQQTREQLASAQREAIAIEQQLASLA